MGYCNKYLCLAKDREWWWAATMDLVQLFEQKSKQSDPNTKAFLKSFYDNHTMNMLPALKGKSPQSEDRALGFLEYDTDVNDDVSYAMLCDGRKRVQIALDKGINFFPVRKQINVDPVGELPSVSGFHVWTCTKVSKDTFTLSPREPATTLPILPKVYKEGYRMTNFDIAYVLDVILHPKHIDTYPYNLLIDNLKRSIDSRHKRNSSRWNTWVPYIINSDVNEGDHWMLAVFKIAEPPKFMLWDSWVNNDYSSTVDKYFKTKFGTYIEQHRTGQQRDGWRCGFFASFWYIYVHFKLTNMQEDIYKFLSDWSPKITPDGWEAFVFLLLKARDVTQDGGYSVHDLGIKQEFTASMLSETLQLSVLSSALESYIAKSVQQ